MAARQQHGFNFEELLNGGFENMAKSESYTATNDAVLYGNTKNVPMSIKTRKRGNELCLGDALRIAASDDELLLLSGTYENKDDIDHIDAYVLKSGWSPYMGKKRNLLAQVFHDFAYYMNHTSGINERDYDSTWKSDRKSYRRKCKDVTEGILAVISARPKRDHKDQHRLQCAITNRNVEKVLSREKVAEADLKTNTVHDIANDRDYICTDNAACLRKLQEIICVLC